MIRTPSRPPWKRLLPFLLQLQQLALRLPLLSRASPSRLLPLRLDFPFQRRPRSLARLLHPYASARARLGIFGLYTGLFFVLNVLATAATCLDFLALFFDPFVKTLLDLFFRQCAFSDSFQKMLSREPLCRTESLCRYPVGAFCNHSKAESKFSSIVAGLVFGLYWPIFSMNRPSLGDLLSAATMEKMGRPLRPWRCSRMRTGMKSVFKRVQNPVHK